VYNCHPVDDHGRPLFRSAMANTPEHRKRLPVLVRREIAPTRPPTRPPAIPGQDRLEYSPQNRVLNARASGKPAPARAAAEAIFTLRLQPGSAFLENLYGALATLLGLEHIALARTS